MAWLDGNDLVGKTMVDFGCGSGLLAIAAAKLGAARVYAVDNDPQAIQATSDNAVANHVSDIVKVVAPPAIAPSPTPGNMTILFP